MLDDGPQAVVFGDGFIAAEYSGNAAYQGTLAGGTKWNNAPAGKEMTFASFAESLNPTKAGWLELYNPVPVDTGCVDWDLAQNVKVPQSEDCSMQYMRLPEMTNIRPTGPTGFSFSAWVHFDEYGSAGSGDISPASRILWLSDDELDEDYGNKIIVGSTGIDALGIVTKDGYKSDFEVYDFFEPNGPNGYRDDSDTAHTRTCQGLDGDGDPSFCHLVFTIGQGASWEDDPGDSLCTNSDCKFNFYRINTNGK